MHLISKASHHQHKRFKHIYIDCHFIHNFVRKQFLTFIHVIIEHEITDIFTKALPAIIFNCFIDKLEIINIYSPTFLIAIRNK